jgi:endonuclease YncB( thermonuclease family)
MNPNKWRRAEWAGIICTDFYRQSHCQRRTSSALSARLSLMTRTLATICLTLAALLGSAACAPNSGQGLVIASGAVTEKPKSGLEVSFTKLIVGHASVIDGDTIEIHGQRIRFHGIDAPESGQSCTVWGKGTRCGRNAALALSGKINNRTVQCEQKDIDRYKRIIAVCRAGGEDLNGWMVAKGWAQAYRRYSLDYLKQEDTASRSKVGIWQGEFIAPWDWRRGKRLEPKQTQQPGICLIKGNINRRGSRIYHVPSGQYYSRTKINQSKSERWFCSEEEAVAAGWRRSKR